MTFAIRPAPALAVLLTLGLTACTAATMPTRMAPEELLAALRSGAGPAVVDVRTRWEYDRAHVPGAVHIPFYALPFRRAAIPSGRGETVVLYCEHGPRAGIARLALRLAGFADLRYLDGHMAGWKARGLPTEGSAGNPDEPGGRDGAAPFDHRRP